MKYFLKNGFFVLLLIVSLPTNYELGNRGLKLTFGLQPMLAQQTLPLSVAIPLEASVVLKNNEIIKGKIMDIDAKKGIIRLQGREQYFNLPVDNIVRNHFTEEALAFRDNGDEVLRSGGKTSPMGSPITWTNVPLYRLHIQDPVRGRGKVILPADAVRNLPEQNGGNSTTYVVNEIRFDSQKRNMTIQATPY